MPCHNVHIEAGNYTLSGLLARPEGFEQVGIILALHGGGYRAGYWDCPHPSGSSLLTLGASLGYAVLAIDRPGYGATGGLGPKSMCLETQAEVIFDAIEHWIKKTGTTGPLFVIGHSIGGILTLLMAASSRGNRLLAGVDVSGVPLQFTAESATVMARQPIDTDYLPDISPDFARNLFFGPDGSFEASALVFDRSLAASVPTAEYLDARDAPRTLPLKMREIRVPVQYTMPEFEQSSETGAVILDTARGYLTSSRRVLTHLQAGAGHNISLHKVARAYHLRSLAFFDECRYLSEQHDK
jgi:pimeloyl-ACP methyl ester carboxylesterase